MQELRFANDSLRWQLQRAQRQLSASEERNQLLSTQLYTLIDSRDSGGGQSGSSSSLSAHTNTHTQSPAKLNNTIANNHVNNNNSPNNNNYTTNTNNSRGTSDAQYKRTIAKLEEENKRLTSDNDQLRLELACVSQLPLSLPPPESTPDLAPPIPPPDLPTATAVTKRRSVNFSTSSSNMR